MRLAAAIGDVNVGYVLPEYTAYPHFFLSFFFFYIVHDHGNDNNNYYNTLFYDETDTKRC